jgi:hypothetical protein
MDESSAAGQAELDAEPLAKPTLLDDIAGRFGQIFKMN